MMNLTVLVNTNQTSTEVEDFDLFDLRDGLNVVAYSVMSSSKFEAFTALSLGMQLLILLPSSVRFPSPTIAPMRKY